MKKQSILAKLVCDYYICEARGAIPRCYLNTGENSYKVCRRYKVYNSRKRRVYKGQLVSQCMGCIAKNGETIREQVEDMGFDKESDEEDSI